MLLLYNNIFILAVVTFIFYFYFFYCSLHNILNLKAYFMYLDQLSNRLKIDQISIKNEKILFKKTRQRKINQNSP